MSENERLALIRQVLLDERMALPYRIAGGLVLLYGMPATRVVALRAEQVRADESVSINIAGDDWVEAPEPFASLLHRQLQGRWNMQTAANRTSPWLFPGRRAGAHLSRMRLVDELAECGIPLLRSRNGAWQQMAGTVPPAVLAKALGISVLTASRHASAAGSDWMNYVTLRTGEHGTVDQFDAVRPGHRQ